ncbi:MAG: hypothetical protein NVS1B13_08310 [Flavisolibacter sp.]
MKKIQVFTVAILVLTACKKNNDIASSTIINNANNSITANVAGSSWKPDFTYAVDSTNTIYVEGVVGSTNINHPASYLIIALPDNISSGSTVNLTENAAAALIFSDSANAYFAEKDVPGASGTVTISRYDKNAKRIEGSFSAVAKNINQDGTSKTISNGQFGFNYK